MKALRMFAVIAAIESVALASCGSGGGASMPTQPTAALPAPTPYTGPAGLASFQWGKELLAHATRVGTVDESAVLNMNVLVDQRDSAGLVQYAQDVSNPKSANYRRFLTPQQIASQYGASLSDYQKAAAYFQQNGIAVAAWPQREMLYLSGHVANYERAFNTKFAVYQLGNQQIVAPNGTPHLNVALPVAQVAGMVNAHVASRYLMRGGNGLTRGYTPQQMRRAFDYSGAYSGGFTGAGINVAIVGTGPISAADPAAYAKQFNVTLAPIQQVDVTNEGVAAGLAKNSPAPSPVPTDASYGYVATFSTPPPTTGTCSSGLPACNPEDLEAQLDTETVAAMAPGSNVLFYLGYSANCQLDGETCGSFGAPVEGISITDPEIQQIIADNKADVVSMSYGLGEQFGVADDIFQFGLYTAEGYGYGTIEMATMVSEGMAVFASSGDNGPYSCGGLEYIVNNAPCPSWPSGDPSVVSVGGVTGPLNDDGTVVTKFTAWGDETTGGGAGGFQNDIGSGGGISTVFVAPQWQQAAGISSITNGKRGQPDIALMADPNTAPEIVANAAFGYESVQLGGTSLASPEMAAMWSLVLQACKADAVCASKGSGAHPYRLGDPNPLLYAIYENKTQYASTITDIVDGDNAASPLPQLPGYAATTGYDLVTGIGVPHAGHLIDAILTNEGETHPPVLP